MNSQFENIDEVKAALKKIIDENGVELFRDVKKFTGILNDYMPDHIRVLSSENGSKLEPDMVTTPFDTELEFTEKEKQQIVQLKNDNAVDELFQLLFIKECNSLNKIVILNPECTISSFLPHAQLSSSSNLYSPV